MHPVAIAGSRLTLREFQVGDVDALLAIYGDPVVVQHLSFEPRTREQVEATVAHAIAAAQQDERLDYSLAAVLRNGKLVASARLAIDVGHPLQSSAQIGFALRGDQWGHGLGSETIGLLLRLGFEHLGVYRIWGARSPSNEASARTMAKMGLVEEGVMRGHLRLADGLWRDSVVHSILAPEWSP
ncbi:GNAT family N-acetyltransferase [Nonomuraea polychroma]|uniref:GNAT family N-acetyltransferase n=1 Tax=Nonomuraea polychroma TaxID=46176 RepID=UPI003D8F99D2